MKRKTKTLTPPPAQVQFICDECEKEKLEESYAMTLDGKKICFECCGILDGQELANLAPGKTMTLYFHKGNITNWPSTLKIPVDTVKVGGHNIAGKRTDIWFHYAGHRYHAVQLGSTNDIVRIRKLKPKPKTKAKKISEKNLWPTESFEQDTESN